MRSNGSGSDVEVEPLRDQKRRYERSATQTFYVDQPPISSNLTAIYYMSKRYCKEECPTATKRKSSQKPLTSRDNTGSRVITQSCEGVGLSIGSGTTPDRLRSSIQQQSHKSGQSTTLIRSTSITDSKVRLVKDKQQAKKIGWGTILDEVGFLKQKISQIERPTFGREQSVAPPKPIDYNVIRSQAISQAQHKRSTIASDVLGREYTLQSIHLLYEEIVYLRNENQLLKDSLRHTRDELEYERKQSVKMARTMSSLTTENEKMRNEFLNQGRKLEQDKRISTDSYVHEKSQNSFAGDTVRHAPTEVRLPRSRPVASEPTSGVLSQITNRQSRQQTLSTYPSKHVTNTYESLLPSQNAARKDSSQENLLDQVQPQAIDRRLKQLNEKFEILLFNSKHEKGRDGRMNIKEQLFAVTTEIKALQQQKALLTCLH